MHFIANIFLSLQLHNKNNTLSFAKKIVVPMKMTELVPNCMLSFKTVPGEPLSCTGFRSHALAILLNDAWIKLHFHNFK